MYKFYVVVLVGVLLWLELGLGATFGFCQLHDPKFSRKQSINSVVRIVN
jgi:hypothetical protein